jgi:outer membrane autotransporter protein
LLLADGSGSTITAQTGQVILNAPNGGATAAVAQNGGKIVLDDGTEVNLLGGGGNRALFATGAGSEIEGNNITITLNSSGGNDSAARATLGANVQLTDSTVNIRANGGGTTALQADGQATNGTPSTLSATRTTVNFAGGDASVGARALSNGQVTLTDSTISMTGSGGSKVGVLANSGTLTANQGTTITVAGTGNDIGAEAMNSGAVTLSGGSVTMPSNSANERAVVASGAGSMLTADGVTISVPASTSGVGARADTAGTVTLGAGTSVSTGGSGALGLQATGSNSAITATGSVTVSTSGANGAAVDADSSGTVSLNGGGKVTTTGAGSAGFNASGGTISATNIITQTSGASAPGGIIQNGGALTINGGSVTTTGAGSYGFLTQGSAGATNMLQIGSAAIRSAADAFRIQGTRANIIVNGSSVIGNNGLLLSTLAPATVALDAATSQLTGAILTDSGSSSNVSLNDETTWTMTGSSNVTALANNGSRIDFTPPAADGAFKTLTVNSNYSGNRGVISLNTLLNAGGPLSNQFTDRLLVQGNAGGTTTIEIVNAGGDGAITSFTGVPDPADGISVIQVAGSSTAGAFTLPDGYITGGTPFAYHLNAYGPGAPFGAATPAQTLAGSPTTHWDYRLQSAYVDPGGVVPPEPTPPTTTPPTTPPPTTPPPSTTTPEEPLPPPTLPDQIPPDPGPSAGDPPFPADSRPEVAPQVPAYLSTARALFETNFLDIDSLHRRLGEIRDDQTLGYDPDAETFVRVYGGLLNYTTNRSFQAFGYNFSLDYSAVQFGANGMPIRNDDGTLRVGLAGTLGRLWMQPSAIDGESKALFNTESVAGIATWQDHSGWYVDGIAMGGMFDGRYTTADRGETTGINGTSVAASIEAGIPFALPWQHLSFEPQAQLVFQHLNFPSRTDVDGIDVDMGNPNQGVLRLGFRLKRPFENDNGMLFTPYFKANLLQGIGGSSDVVLSGIPFGTGTPGTALQVGGGITGTLSRRVAIYGDAAWQSNVANDGGFRGWVLNGGLRLSFGAPPPAVPAPVAAPVPSSVRSYLVFFDWDDASLTDRARQVIANAAAASTSVRYTRITVNGYTDTSGSPSYNQGLSVRRARAVAEELVRDGVPSSVIAIHGFGETHLLVPTGPGVREAQNRRVEIFIQ